MVGKMRSRESDFLPCWSTLRVGSIRSCISMLLNSMPSYGTRVWDRYLAGKLLSVEGRLSCSGPSRMVADMKHLQAETSHAESQLESQMILMPSDP